MISCSLPDSDKLPQVPTSRNWKDSVQFGIPLSSSCIRIPEGSQYLKEKLFMRHWCAVALDNCTPERRDGHTQNYCSWGRWRYNRLHREHRKEKGFCWEHPQKLHGGDGIWAEILSMASPIRYTQEKRSDWINWP